MADIILKVGFDTGNEAVELCRSDLETVIKKLETPKSKVKVGLTVDDVALKNFKSKLEGILASVTTDKGAPIKINISGIGDVSTQIDHVKKSTSDLKKEIDNAGKSTKVTTKSISEVEQQLRKLDTIISQTERNLSKWSAAKNGSSKESYRALEEELNTIKSYRATITSTGSALDDFNKKYSSSSETIRRNSAEIKNNGENVQALGDHIGSLVNKFGSWLSISQGVMFVIRSLKKMASSVIELDTAMTELKKVTNETNAVYDRFLTNAATRARDLGTTLNDVVIATADFVRLGHSMSDASDLADAAIVYKNVGDGIENINQASESIISTMQAFGIEASKVISIVDRFNNVGNNFAISSTGIGEALLNSASALASANNSLDESIALITAANEVVQSPEKVGTAMKTLSMYIRAAKTEAEEAGIATDGMAESVSELRSQILDLTGSRVDIMIDDTTFKSTFDIIKELSEIWGTLSETTQANITELIGGGVRNSNVINALMSNFATAEEVVASAANSAGSALAENEKYLDSIQGRLDKFQASWQSLSANIIDSDWIKLSVSGVTGLLDGLNWAIEASNGLALALAAIPVVKLVGNLELVKDSISAVKAGFTNFVGGAKTMPLRIRPLYRDGNVERVSICWQGDI